MEHEKDFPIEKILTDSLKDYIAYKNDPNFSENYDLVSLETVTSNAAYGRQNLAKKVPANTESVINYAVRPVVSEMPEAEFKRLYSGDPQSYSGNTDYRVVHTTTILATGTAIVPKKK